MKLDLYSTTDDNNVINKTLTLVHEIDISLKRSDNINSLDIIISRTNYDTKINYAKISLLNRCYFVSDKTELNNEYISLHLENDVLETNRGIILTSHAVIIGKATPSYLSSSIPVDTRTESNKYESDVSLPDTSSYVLVTIGG